MMLWKKGIKQPVTDAPQEGPAKTFAQLPKSCIIKVNFSATSSVLSL